MFVVKTFSIRFAGFINWIQSHLGPEYRVTLLMGLIYFCLCFIRSLLRIVKDSLVVTAEGASVEVIPFIQLWMMLPATLVAAWLFTRLTSRHSQYGLFHVVMGGFIAFFAFFALVLYPLRDVLHPHALASDAMAYVPSGLYGFVTMLHNWTFSLFYTISELWASIVTAVLFWGFANAISSLQDAQRSYGFYAIGGNIGAILAGLTPAVTSHISPEASVYLLMLVLIATAFAVIKVFRYLTTRVLADSHQSLCKTPAASKGDLKIAPTKSMFSLLRNPYLLCMAIMVLTYNCIISITGLVWKDQLKLLCPDFNSYNNYLGYTTSAIGTGALILATLSPFLLKRFGWTLTALICPVAILGASTLFFGCLFGREYMPLESGALLSLIVFVGTLTEVFGRMTKFSVFDNTKDMAYIPLPADEKLNGKAVVDGACSRVGCSMAAGMHQFAIIALSSIGDGLTAMAGAVALALVLWMGALQSLGQRFAHLTQQKPQAMPEGDSEATKVAA